MTAPTRPLRIEPRTPAAPPELGRALSAEQVAVEVYGGLVTPAWVRRNVPWGRYRPGHRTVIWWEKPLRAGLAQEVTT